MYKEVALSFYVEARIPEICAFSNIAQRLKARIRLQPKRHVFVVHTTHGVLDSLEHHILTARLAITLQKKNQSFREIFLFFVKVFSLRHFILTEFINI